MRSGTGGIRIGVLIVAYNAASTLASVLDRLPRSFCARVSEVLVFDDASDDDTYAVGLGYQAIADMPITVVRHRDNLGYGGNQKAGYLWALDHQLDVVVLLHGDGQYAPEVIESLVAPLEDGRADAVFGSRLIVPGAARAGGMPLYKLVGNRVLTRYENAVVGTSLTEWHSGYRAYRVDALADIPFERNSDGFDFDTEIVVQLHEAGKSIVEVPIPTYYGDEICHVNGLRYARDVVVDVTRYRLHKFGLGSGELAFAADEYEIKLTPHSSHGQLLAWIGGRPATTVLDVGCADGRFGQLVREAGHRVVGLDRVKHPDVGDRLDGFVEADLNHGLPEEAGSGYGVIVAADVLEHTIDPGRLLDELRERLDDDGVLYVSVPNFAHWYPRLRTAVGRFDYDRRGILDASHVRFFTRRSIERLLRKSRFEIARRSVTGLPFEILPSGERGSQVVRRASAAGRVTAAAWPSMLAYQLLYELRPT